MNKIKLSVLLTIILQLSIAIGSCFAQQKNDEKGFWGYLMVYFKDDTHSLYFAMSKDGYTFTDVNQGKPVIKGDSIANQKGVRDPYIMRDVDGVFYMAMTDLHISGKEQGFRQTTWERDEKEFAWGNNSSIVLMKSKDLIKWSHHVLRLDKAFPDWDRLGCAWAPELIYDHVKKKNMLYLTMRFGNGLNQLYYAYMNNDFTALATEPQLLFQYPKANKAVIDGDIIFAKGKYRLFYVPHDGTPGIKQATSNNMNTDYTYVDQWIDPEPYACEAPHVWKRIGEEKWVLMYDIYGISPHNFGISETTDFVSFRDLGRFNEGRMKATNSTSPEHASVIHITRAEADRLAKAFNFTF